MVGVVIPAVMGIAAAEARVLARAAVVIQFRKVVPEQFEAIVPHVAEAIRADVALDDFRASFDVEACANVSVCHDGSCVDACIAQPVPFAHPGLILES